MQEIGRCRINGRSAKHITCPSVCASLHPSVRPSLCVSVCLMDDSLISTGDILKQAEDASRCHSTVFPSAEKYTPGDFLMPQSWRSPIRNPSFKIGTNLRLWGLGLLMNKTLLKLDFDGKPAGLGFGFAHTHVCTHAHTGGQTENIMPPAPSTGWANAWKLSLNKNRLVINNT